VEALFHIFLISALGGGECLASRRGNFSGGTHCIGGWVGPKTDVDTVAGRENPIIAPTGN